MTIAEVPDQARAAVQARRRKEIDELDYRRELHRLGEQGFSQRDISKWLGIAQPSVLSALKTAAKVPMPVDGFSGATPYEICQRYAAGFIDRAQLVDELTRFPYAEGGQTDGYDSLMVDPPGAWAEVSDARRRGLIADDVYEEVFNARHGRAEAEKPAQAEGAVLPTQDMAIQWARALVKAAGGGEVRVHDGNVEIQGPSGMVANVVNRNGRGGTVVSKDGSGWAVVGSKGSMRGTVVRDRQGT